MSVRHGLLCNGRGQWRKQPQLLEAILDVELRDELLGWSAGVREQLRKQH
jgi:hypothetical protein